MNCLVVDDNKIARTALKHLVNGVSFLKLAGGCENAEEARNFLDQQTIDLILLDVEMPKVSGLDFLRSVPNHPLVILITGKAEYAVDAFEHNVVDFLLKPIKEERFLKAVNRAKEIFESTNKTLELDKEFFFIREKGVSTKLLLADILYIQALGDYVSIYTPQKKYTIHYTLSAIEKELPASKFMRIHRSYIVAIDKIDSFEEGAVYIYQSAIPVSDAQRAELTRRLHLL